jgi:chromosome partitioning protein
MYTTMNKIILCANVKGGVGKTCICALFANYLKDKDHQVLVCDIDYQASLYRHREREVEANPDVPIPWEVQILDTSNRQSLIKEIVRMKQYQGIVLIDCPGTLNAVNLDIVYQAADLLVIPMSYDFDTVDATGLFIKVIRKVYHGKLVFVPNRINTSEGKSEELKQREQTISLLGRIGVVAPRIKQSVVIKRYSTLFGLDKYQHAAIEHAFERIIDELNK